MGIAGWRTRAWRATLRIPQNPHRLHAYAPHARDQVDDLSRLVVKAVRVELRSYHRVFQRCTGFKIPFQRVAVAELVVQNLERDAGQRFPSRAQSYNSCKLSRQQSGAIKSITGRI